MQTRLNKIVKEVKGKEGITSKGSLRDELNVQGATLRQILSTYMKALISTPHLVYCAKEILFMTTGV